MFKIRVFGLCLMGLAVVVFPRPLAVAVAGEAAQTKPMESASNPAKQTTTAPSFRALAASFKTQVAPLLRDRCLNCHSMAKRKGELDLQRFGSLSSIREDPRAWQRVAEMLDNGEMPPAGSKPLMAAERKTMRNWVESYLTAEALAAAGDPGPVVLRRLNNAEYNYTVQDLTGVDSLQPTLEFPVDGAAGEGFTNAGAAQSMSPALVQKYLDAAKQVARHMVLLPDGIRFSRHVSERDRSDELLARIQAFYRRYSNEGVQQAPILPGSKFNPKQEGTLPLQPYLLATLEERAAIRKQQKSIQSVAKERSLNVKYLSSIWEVLNQEDELNSFLLNQIRDEWRTAEPADSEQLTRLISRWQKVLWQFNSIGHFGSEGRPKQWMAPSNTLATDREVSLELPASRSDIELFLNSSALGRQANDYAIWDNPRLQLKNGVSIALRDLPSVQERIKALEKEELARTARYLAAAAEFASQDDTSIESRKRLAQKHGLEWAKLDVWLNYLSLANDGPVQLTGHIQQKHNHPNYAFVRGWGVPQTPIVLANSSDREVRIPGISRPRSVVVHPSPSMYVATAWQSPMDGRVRVQCRIADAHPECGNGQEWMVRLLTQRGVGELGRGEFERGGKAQLADKVVSVRKGQVISLIIGPRNGEHTCDLTALEMVVSEQGGGKRSWDLAKDCSANIQAANPHADNYGNAGVWHFYQRPLTTLSQQRPTRETPPLDSLLGEWLKLRDATKKTELAERIQAWSLNDFAGESDTPNAILHRQLRRLLYDFHLKATLSVEHKGDQRFGAHPAGRKVKPQDLVVPARSRVKISIPAAMGAGAKLLATTRADAGSRVGVQMFASLGTATATPSTPVDRLVPPNPGLPILVPQAADVRQAVERALQQHRDLFPPALCYARIVPVDEVVTLTLYYRQDEALQRLMLDAKEVQELNRLWDELWYVAREPFKFQVAFEQIREFATQDRPDLVKQFDPLVEMVNKRSAAFQQRLRRSEPRHLAALLEFADRAWRRPLSSREVESLRRLYRTLRDAELDHERAMRLTLARILTSPAFLYRREMSPPEREIARVSELELASRLSYFLWSSAPDRSLRAEAENGTLDSDSSLELQTMRMLRDPRIRRLAIQFACQWLHVRDFDQTVAKNEKLYPQFDDLRGDMNEETVLFFADLFGNNRSVLSMLDAKHTFLNPRLASHYGIAGLSGEGFRRVDGVEQHGRGGVLAMSSVLASQSGASRTSPILRGNWIYETILGQRLPRPPADVPVLPDLPPRGMTARQLIEQHSANPSCAKCHAKIDHFGFALEQYDAIGRLRPEQTDTNVRLPNGGELAGIAGLRNYLLTVRRTDVLQQFCRKLLGFALGREVLLSDRPLIDKMMRELEANDYRFAVAVKTIVLSRQFRNIRGQAHPAQNNGQNNGQDNAKAIAK